MKYPLILLLLLPAATTLSAQDTKGAQPSNQQPSNQQPSNQTRAVVVGISDYQANAIPDLTYAHQDAQAFAGWLQSPAGGNVPEQNITLLTNAGATYAAVATALYSMLDVCKPGERFIFYFSGHGDVEAKISTQPGYLLCHDSPANVYMVGAFNLRDLQSIVTTLSENGVKVVLVTDACHAGKLAGAGIGGTQATAAALSKQIANEVKIMSCQPNEFSLEGEQWGGGAFSANLLEGLTGLSDRNNDGVVNLFEITRYLQDNVPAQTAPLPQMPMSVGDLQTTLNAVDAASLAGLKTKKSGAVAWISAIGSKGLEEDILAKTDSLTRQRYLDFKKQIAAHVFFEPRYDCADDLFRELIRLPQLQPLHGLMTRNYAVALLDEVQQAINALLDNDPYEANRWRYSPGKYTQYPAYLQRSMELLGEKHYMNRALAAKKLYFEGYNLLKNVGEFQNEPARRDSFRRVTREKFLESLQLQPEAAYVYFAIGQTFSFEFNPVYQTDSVEFWGGKAIELAPGWLQPYLEIAHEYGNGQVDFATSETWLNKALAIAPKSYLVLERLSWLKQWQNKPDESIAISKRMIELKPNIFNAWSTMAQSLTMFKGAYYESEKYCLKSLELEPNQGWWAGVLLGINYYKTRRTDLAIQHLTKQLELPAATIVDKSSLTDALIQALIQKGDWAAAERYCKVAEAQYFNNPPAVCIQKSLEGKLYFLQNRFDEAEKKLREALVADPTYNGMWPLDWAILGEIAALRGDTAAAAQWFQKVVNDSYFFGYNATLDEAFFRYGKYLLAQNRSAEAEVQFREISVTLPRSYFHGYGMALGAAKRGKHTEALDWLEKSLDNFWPEAESIQAEPLFKNLRKTKRYRELLAKHFPETGK
ncbi:MAG: caspase family protein [Lewinellaceae bacterium]|nr:caspase family protein [Lewinellaceae bacterium]